MVNMGEWGGTRPPSHVTVATPMGTDDVLILNLRLISAFTKVFFSFIIYSKMFIYSACS